MPVKGMNAFKEKVFSRGLMKQESVQCWVIIHSYLQGKALGAN